MKALLRGLMMTTCLFWAGGMIASNETKDPSANPSKENYLSPDLGYEMTDVGYICSPMETPFGIVCTNNRSSEIYLLQDGVLRTMVTSRGAGRYMQLNADKTKLAFKLINEYGEQAPAILDLATETVQQLQPFADQCGQPAFGNDGMVAYSIGETLVVEAGNPSDSGYSGGGGKSGNIIFELGYYSNTMAFSPDGKQIALTDGEQRPVLLSLETGEQRLLAEMMGCYEPKWSPDGEHVLYQRNNQQLYCFCRASGEMFCLGRGHSAVWLNNKEIAFSRAEYINDDVFFYKGTSVVRARLDGSHRQTLIDCSDECPQDIALLDNGHLAVAYANGNRRISEIDMAQPDKETALFTIPMNKEFGAILPAMQMSRIAKLADAVISPLEIPYINQKHDVPKVDGSYGYGPCACAPSTACMLLGYYKQLPHDHPITSRAPGRPWGKDIYYSWYVGQAYTSPLTNYTFNLTAGSSCEAGKYASGGYGYMWNGNNSPYTVMASFYRHNGVQSAVQDVAGASTIKRECLNGRPYSWCVTSVLTSGHLILPFAGDAMCAANGSDWQIVTKSGSVVVHDPYGNANRPGGASWGGSDGRHVTYDVEGYNNGNLLMYNAWGVSVTRGSEIADALETIAAQSSVDKIVQNGQLIIIRDGQRYDVLGRPMN